MLKKIQAGTGIIIAVFVAFHLLNSFLATFSAAAYDSVQQVFRAVYHFAPLEVALLAAIATHLGVGIARIVREPKRTLSLRGKLHRYSGMFLGLVIFGHIFAVRAPSLLYGAYTEFAGLSFTINYFPEVFYPYYFLLGLCGFFHALNGLNLAVPRLGRKFSVSSPLLYRSTGLAAALLVATLLGFGGFWFEVGETALNDYAKLYLEFFDVQPKT